MKVWNGTGWVTGTRKRWDGTKWAKLGGAAAFVDPPTTLPYTFPTAAPWNSTITGPTITPTDDGTGETIHPSVVDFGATPWNGYRYWMASTAFYNAEVQRENPHIHCSHDGHTWVIPAGLTNPIDPWPGAPADTGWYNSDTELVYDPDGGRLVVTWREYKNTAYELIWGATSTNGSTWSAPVEVLKVTGTPSGSAYASSQTMVRVAANDWRMFTYDSSNTIGDRMWTSTSPLGPFINPQTAVWTGPIVQSYHGGMTYYGGKFYMITQSEGKEYPASSHDGINWKSGAPVLEGIANTWQPALYKSALVPTPDGTKMQVWYTVHGNVYGRHVGYTRIPMSIWTALL